MRFSFSAFVFHVVVLETTAIQANPFYGSTKDKKKTKKNPLPATATAPPTPTPPVRYLVAQPGLDCSLRAQQPVTLTGLNLSFSVITGSIPTEFGRISPIPKEATEVTGTVPDAISALYPLNLSQLGRLKNYTLRATVSNETIAFAERPARSALTVSTQDFVDVFEDDLFKTSNPNGAITFVSDATASSSAAAAAALDGPLIAVLSEPEIVGTSPDNSTFVIEYNITQSDSQRAVGSIEPFLDNTFRSCSIFIDGCIVPENLSADLRVGYFG